jgi:hypothetical protein
MRAGRLKTTASTHVRTQQQLIQPNDGNQRCFYNPVRNIEAFG